MHPWELQPGDPAWDRRSETQRARGPEKERWRKREREKRDKESQRAGARLRAGKGVRARGSLSQALIMGGRAGAEGSLFEVCGERHQRKRREASRAVGVGGDTGGAALCSGPPGPPSLHPPPCPAPSSLPPICSGLARGPTTWSPAWGSGSCKSLLPSQHPQGQGRFLALGTAWTGEGQVSLAAPAAVPSLSPKKYVLASFGPPTFGILR